MIHIYQQTHTQTHTHLLKHFVELLQGWSHSPGSTHTPRIAIEVDIGKSVQRVMTKGTDYRGPHCPVFTVREVGLTIDRRLVQSGIVTSIKMLPSVRLEPLHQENYSQTLSSQG